MAAPTATHCTFCDLIHGAAEVSVCYQDADAVAFMDIQPVNAGHVLVVPRHHFESLFDVPRELGVHLFDVTMRLASVVRGVTDCTDMNIIVNSGPAAGQDEPHYHVHIIPRRKGDGFDVPLPFDGSEMPDRQRLDAMAARIIAAMQDPMRSEGSSGGRGSARAAAPAGGMREGAHGELTRTEGVSGATRRPPREVARATAPVERERPLMVAAEGRPVAASQRPEPGPLLDREGPHGELVRDAMGAD